MKSEMSLDENHEVVLQKIREIWDSARTHAVRSVNTHHVYANWLTGRQIILAEQGGADRAKYGSMLLKQLSVQLSQAYGSGFSVSALQYMRAFFQAYPELLENQHSLRVIFPEIQNTWKPGILHPALSWTHYRSLIKVDRIDARDFYEIETIKNSWSARQLERQINSLLYDRIAKSRDKEGVLALANEGLSINRPVDLIKDPYVLEFLDLPESHQLVESKVEEAIISQLQSFLLELGSGFAFVGRQIRLTLDGDHYYPDLVFYHTKLKCYIIIDIKVKKLTHGDLGQMQLYVNYYDREVADVQDQPTIGLILCTDKNEAMVRYVLDEKNQQIFASRYQFHLPSEEILRAEVKRELERLEIDNNEHKDS